MDADGTKVFGASTKMILPQCNSGQWKLHLETIWAQSQHSSTEHPVSAWVHWSPSNPCTLDTISNHFWKGQERSKEKQIFDTQKPVPSPLLFIMGHHLPEALKSIWALSNFLFDFDDFRQNGSAARKDQHAPEQGRGDVRLSYRALTVMLLWHRTTCRGGNLCEKGLTHLQMRGQCNQSCHHKTTFYTPKALSRGVSSSNQVNTRKNKCSGFKMTFYSACGEREEWTCDTLASQFMDGSLVCSSSHAFI